MITQNLPTLKIHQLTDEQYKRVKESADYDPNALYLTPDEEIDLSILERTFDENGVIKQNALPEGYPYVTSGEVLPMTSISIDSYLEGTIVDKFSLVEGEEYEVIWNGVSYTCTGVEYLDGLPLICLGDLAAFEGREPTDYPFLVARIADDATAEVVGAYGMVISYEDLTDVNLSINGTIIYQIDKKFVPTPDVVTNIVNGDNVGSVRNRYAQPNDDEYQIGEFATALGYLTKASGDYSHAEGESTTASGDYSHAEGESTTASGDYSHAECEGTTASGYSSHAEGEYTTASGYSSHAEGFYTLASGNYSHAEGYRTTASGYYSHAEGKGTKAFSGHQHVQGKYNIEDTSASYAHIVGNGSDGNPSNAHTLDWDGNAWFQGDVYVGGTSQDEGSRLISESDISEFVTNFNPSSKLLIATVNEDGVVSVYDKGEQLTVSQFHDKLETLVGVDKTSGYVDKVTEFKIGANVEGVENLFFDFISVLEFGVNYRYSFVSSVAAENITCFLEFDFGSETDVNRNNSDYVVGRYRRVKPITAEEVDTKIQNALDAIGIAEDGEY